MTMQTVSSSSLEPGRGNPRKAMDRNGLEGLAASIRNDGLLQNLVVRPVKGKGEHYRVDLASAWYNLATAQMQLSQPAIAASGYLKARDIEVGIYGENHADLISTEYSLAAALHACADHEAAADAIDRCLRIIRLGSQQARVWRHRALRLAVIIDLADNSQQR